MKQPVTLTELRDEIMRQLESSKVVTIKLAERGFLYELIASINDGIEGAKMRRELAEFAHGIINDRFQEAFVGKRGDAEKFCNIIPKPTGPLTGDEEVFVGGRWVNASTMPNYDDNTEYIWRRNVT